MSNLTEMLHEDQRLVILRLLENIGFTANDSVLEMGLRQFGHRVTRDQVRGELQWLAEQGLITIEVIAGRVHVATLTDRGAEVATGRAHHPGVRRPSPGSLHR